jgi:hypothetical protein
MPTAFKNGMLAAVGQSTKLDRLIETTALALHNRGKDCSGSAIGDGDS